MNVFIKPGRIRNDIRLKIIAPRPCRVWDRRQNAIGGYSIHPHPIQAGASFLVAAI